MTKHSVVKLGIAHRATLNPVNPSDPENPVMLFEQTDRLFRIARIHRIERSRAPYDQLAYLRMTPDGYKAEAATLKASNASLSQLIQFVRKYDPTEELRREWGANYQSRLDYLLGKARDAAAIGTEFPGSDAEVLLCMAYLVTTAPYLGVPEAAIRSQLWNMLAEL